MTWSRPVVVGSVLSSILVPASIAAAQAPSPSRIVLLPGLEASSPGFEVLSTTDGACRLRFVLPALEDEVVPVADEKFHALTIPGGAVTGPIGMPALPTYGGLLAIPPGRSVRATVSRRETRKLESIRLLPVQPEDADGFVIDADYDKADPRPRPIVTLGEPAILHGRRVLPFAVRPVRADPARRSVEVDVRLEIEFVFEGSDRRNDPERSPAGLPASFAELVDGRIVNPGAREPSKSAGDGGLGTYLVLCPDDAGVVSALRRLLDWRRRQGYHVELATTAETGTSNSAIKSYLQDFHDTTAVPLEFVVLVGDDGGDISLPTWYESLSGYGGEGDHYYALLEGDDVLADVFLGRLSCRDVTELTGIVDKIVGYETTPPTSDPDWFTRASLTADPSSSGTSTIYVSQWLKAQLEAISFTHIDTFWSGNYATQMLTTLNQGVSLFTYRGYLGMSGFHSGHINSATNGKMLPFAVFPTCDSGSWASETDARNEAFLRNPNGGAIGAVGLATIGTHTRYNNALFHGIGEAVTHGDDHRLGVAQASGKLEVYRQYQPFEPNRVEIWSVWSSLIGDPATDVWLSYPRTLTVDHPAGLPLDAGAVPVRVTEGGAAVPGAVVALYKEGEISRTALTGADGSALLTLPAHTAGSLLVTVWGHGLQPYRGSLTLGDVDLFVELAQTAVDDDDAGGSQGDGDGSINPAETIQLDCELLNRGSLLAGSVTAILASADPYLSVIDGADGFGDIAGGATAWGEGGFRIEVDPTAPDGHVPSLTLTVASGADEWVSAVPLPVVASDLTVAGADWSAGSTLDPGESGTLILTLDNLGARTAAAAAGVLSSGSPWIAIADGHAAFGDIGPGASGGNASDPFVLEIAADCFAGHLATFSLEVTASDGSLREIEFNLPVGTVTTADPVGPDAYGYYALDDTDVGYVAAPVYDWVEIDPSRGGPGTDVGLNDFGYEQDDTRIVDLPFPFTYYGREYHRIAVCSNGWIAMGNTTLVHWRNWSIPSAGSPDPLIAPFWDDLSQSGDNRVYRWHDAANHRLIVQWSRMQNRAGGTQNFQLILHDPLAYPTATGDGEILFQYETVNNNDTGRGYATAGIQDPYGTDGLLYTYYNAYAPGAATLAPGRAILFKPNGPDLAVTCDVSPDSVAVALAKDRQATETLHIANHGEAGSVLRYQIAKVDPAPPTAGKNLTGSSLTADASGYTAGETADIVLTANCVSGDLEWIIQIQADLPAGVVLNSATGFSNSSLDYLGSLGDGVEATWGGGHLADNRFGDATINVTFSGVAGPVEIPYILIGDDWGSAPHQISGTIVLQPSGPSIVVESPDGGENWAEGETREILFHAGGGPETVLIELDRGDSGGWQTLATDVPAAAGGWTWEVAGPISAHCRIRVSDEADAAVFDVSDDEFTIGRDLGWVTVGSHDGFVAAGSSEEITLEFDSTGLADGTYRAELQIANTAGSIVAVPLTLVVADPAAVGELPRTLRLEGNFPNPFNPRTNIRFALPAAMRVELEVFDARGRLVKVLHRGQLPAGTHSLNWDGTDRTGRRVSSGLFFCRLEAGDRVLHQKMLLMK